MTEENKPVFPISDDLYKALNKGRAYEAMGLTKKQYVATEAMKGLLSDVGHWHEIKKMAKKNGIKKGEQLALLSMECAEALTDKF